MKVTLDGGAMAWATFRSTYAGHTFMWQDLDGLHEAALPGERPLTSLAHGWAPDGSQLVRVRIDGDRVWHARIQRSDAGTHDARFSQPDDWGANQRVAQFRSDGTALTACAEVIVDDMGDGAILFLVPPPLAGPWEVE